MVKNQRNIILLKNGVVEDRLTPLLEQAGYKSKSICLSQLIKDWNKHKDDLLLMYDSFLEIIEKTIEHGTFKMNAIVVISSPNINRIEQIDSNVFNILDFINIHHSSKKLNEILSNYISNIPSKDNLWKSSNYSKGEDPNWTSTCSDHV